MYDKLARMMLATLRELDLNMCTFCPAGPYFLGAQFTLVDIAYFPFIDRHAAAHRMPSCDGAAG